MRLQRLLGILAVLLNRRRVRAEALAEQFEVSTRTIHRDLETLEQAGVPIVTYPGVNGGIEILDTYKLDKNVFLNEDFTTILSGLKSISGTLDSAAVNRTLAKLQALIPRNQARQVELSGNKLYIDLKPWSMHPDFEPLLQSVRTALEQDRLLRFTYTARDDFSSSRTVEPHQLVLKGQTWYLRAFCLERNDFRTFRLQRMQNAEISDRTFVPRPFPAELNDFKSWTHPKLITVEIIAEGSMRGTALEYCPPECLTDLPDGSIHINLPFVESDMGYGTLMELGHRCRVISPDHVIKELKHRISLLQKNYEEIN